MPGAKSYGVAPSAPPTSIKSCKLVSGSPGSPGGRLPIDPPGKIGPEIVTFFGATNNFSFNYRNEPLYPRTTRSLLRVRC